MNSCKNSFDLTFPCETLRSFPGPQQRILQLRTYSIYLYWFEADQNLILDFETTWSAPSTFGQAFCLHKFPVHYKFGSTIQMQTDFLSQHDTWLEAFMNKLGTWGGEGVVPMPRMTRFKARVSCSWCNLLLIPSSCSNVWPPSETNIGKSRDYTMANFRFNHSGSCVDEFTQVLRIGWSTYMSNQVSHTAFKVLNIVYSMQNAAVVWTKKPGLKVCISVTSCLCKRKSLQAFDSLLTFWD